MANITLPGTVQQAPAGLSGFDVNSPLSAAQALILKNAGYDFCIRYIPRTANLIRNNLTNAEALDILNAGLALMAVQHVALPGWVPNTNLGTVYGNYAASYANQVVGLPHGMNIWCDLEEVARHTAAADVVAYCQAWYYAVHTAGYTPGLYVGYGVILTDQQLYNDTSFQHYWRAYNGPQVATRGFQLIQKTEKTVNGITIDPDITQNDDLGDAVLWLSTSVPATAIA
ncbi:MAG: hypothetical protein JWP44_408 [Mucilaginibacter sp.]|nr:hypothetical protein [Mucilaginibacter sp.]